MIKQIINWQWDQGRGEYFQFENIVAMSRILVKKEGMLLSDVSDNKDLRSLMLEQVELKFKPESYTVWRNYGRVFKISLLATDIPVGKEKRLRCTEVCRALSEDKYHSATDYFYHMMNNFYLGGHVFGATKYSPGEKRIYPFCAIIRMLAAFATKKNRRASVSPEEIKDFLFSQEITGNEDIEFFCNISPMHVNWKNNDQKRQIREMLIFASQCSFLKWDDGRLHLDLLEHVDPKMLFDRFKPMVRKQCQLEHDEIMNLGMVCKMSSLLLPSDIDVVIMDDLLGKHDLSMEGRRRVANHIIIERSPKLRQIFFSRNKNVTCNITGTPRHAGFPWVDNILEIHHVTPLSSSVYSVDEGAYLENLVALTPTSHRAVHSYYRQWMQKNNRQDFSSKDEAWKIYCDAKEKYLQSGMVGE